MSTLLQKIKENSKFLPKKDIKFADKFIEKRDFESLYELVSADHKIHDRKRNKDGFFDTEEDNHLDEIYNELEGDVLTYVRCIEPDYEVIQEADEFTDNNFIEEDFDW